MPHEDKRIIAGEPEDFDDFANAWYDDTDLPNDEEVGDNRKAKFMTRAQSREFMRKIAQASSLDEAESLMKDQVAIFKRLGASETGHYGASKRALAAIHSMKADDRRAEYRSSRVENNKAVVRYVFPIFTCGNRKLPFWTWSKVPIYTCPGAGRCASDKFCYSLKACAHPNPFFTMIQNTLLAHFRRDIIADAFAQLPDASVLRLHVDGDFESVEDIAAWMDLLRSRQAVFDDNRLVGGISSYTYSKSWPELIAYDKTGEWPKDFWINISSDSRWDGNAALKRQVLALPCTRGEFVVVEDERLPYRKPGQKWTAEQKEAAAAVRAAVVKEDLEKVYGKKSFVCRGKCAICVEHSGHIFRHACGHEAYKGITIGIGKH